MMTAQEGQPHLSAHLMERFRFIRPDLIHIFPNKSLGPDSQIGSSKNNLCLLRFTSDDDLDLFYKVFKLNSRVLIDANKVPYQIGLVYDQRSI